MKRLARVAAVLVTCASSATYARAARAEHDWALFLPVGGTTAYSLHPGRVGNGAVLGGEVSLAWLHNDNLTWFGGYVDAVHDFGSSSSRLSIGPELGKAIFGVDGGLVLSTYGGLHAGVTGRFLISLAVLHLYTRIGTVFDSPAEHGPYGEIGVMLKLPVPLSVEWPGRQRRPPPRAPAAPAQREAPPLPVATPPSSPSDGGV